MPNKSKRYLLRDSDRSGWTYRFIELVKDGPFLVGGDEFDAPPPSNRLYPGEGDVSPGDTRLNYTTYNVPDFPDLTTYLQQDGNDSNTTFLLSFNGVQASTAFPDISASNLSATVIGSAQIVTDQSKFGGASCQMNTAGSTTDYIRFSQNAAFNFSAADFTVDFWYRPATVSVTQYLMGQANSVTSDLAWYFQMSNANPVFVIAGVAQAQTSVTASTSLLANVWYHIAGVRSSDTITLFVDGSSWGTASISTTTLNSSTSNLAVGRLGDSAGANLQGWIDELRVSKTARWIGNFNPYQAEYGAGGQIGYSQEAYKTAGVKLARLNIAGSNGTVQIMNSKQITPAGHQEQVTIQCVDGGISLINGSGLSLFSNYRMNSGAIINLIYNATDNLYYETSRFHKVGGLLGVF